MWLDISAFYSQAVYAHPQKEMMQGHNNNNKSNKISESALCNRQ